MEQEKTNSKSSKDLWLWSLIHFRTKPNEDKTWGQKNEVHVYVEYSANSKAYQLIDFAIGKLKVSRDVVKINEAKISNSKLDVTLAPISGQVLGKNTWAMVDNKLNQDQGLDKVANLQHGEASLRNVDQDTRGILDVANITIGNNVDDKAGDVAWKWKLLLKSWGHLTLKKLN